jgi:hypothetical protein
MLYRCIAAIPNSGGKCVEHFYEDSAEGRRSAEDFARQYDKPGWGVYDCVSPLRERRRTKDSVALIEGLHVDLDAYKAGKTKEEIVNRLQGELGDTAFSHASTAAAGVFTPFRFFGSPLRRGRRKPRERSAYSSDWWPTSVPIRSQRTLLH